MFDIKGSPFQSLFMYIASHKHKQTNKQQPDVVWSANDVRLPVMQEYRIQSKVIPFTVRL
jgi:hypothetical protein